MINNNSNKVIRLLKTFRIWTKWSIVIGSCAGVLSFVLAICCKLAPEHPARVSSDNIIVYIVLTLGMVLAGTMFLAAFVLAIIKELNLICCAHKNFVLKWPSVANILYISLFIFIVILSLKKSCLLILYLAFLWPLIISIVMKDE